MTPANRVVQVVPVVAPVVTQPLNLTKFIEDLQRTKPKGWIPKYSCKLLTKLRDDRIKEELEEEESNEFEVEEQKQQLWSFDEYDKL